MFSNVKRENEKGSNMSQLQVVECQEQFNTPKMKFEFFSSN